MEQKQPQSIKDAEWRPASCSLFWGAGWVLSGTAGLNSGLLQTTSQLPGKIPLSEGRHSASQLPSSQAVIFQFMVPSSQVIPAKVALGHLDHINNFAVYLNSAVLESDSSHFLTPFHFTVCSMLLLKLCSAQCVSLWDNNSEDRWGHLAGILSQRASILWGRRRWPKHKSQEGLVFLGFRGEHLYLLFHPMNSC